MILREEYLNKLIKLKNTKIIKVITGIRRCGKSTLLEMFREYLLQNGVQKEQITAINFEDMDYSELTDYKRLYSYLKERLVPNKMNYIFLDEIQLVESYQKAVDSLYIKENVDLYITGSNAHMLSGELATLLSGRYIEMQMLPLSFKEYLDFVGDRTDLSRKYSDYLQFSSFPYAVSLKNDRSLIRDYLSGIYNTVLLKDVVSRKRISDVMLLESVIRFLFDNIGNRWSTKKISDTMTSDGRKISTHTVETYLSALIDSYIIYHAKRYDVKGKQILKTQEKYYIVDIGLRYYLLGNKGADMGHILENVVYLELLRRGYEVSIGKVDDMEVDFIASNNDGIEYYQVAATVRDVDTLDRELKPLKKIADHFPKYLLTLDDDPPTSHNGIRQINALDFLLN
ncbi:ATPase component BioM of energizing module of biotin ECF transporter [Desulfosporosinus sp. I2]|uniref:ATP-binding protein n=1 Tax=Desulfosporosinus sp. I2 TaxID=1617025 RepID=UPI0005EDBF47|nr:ATP-binding protein [Desulfosporosinus sp. I2]KJR45502.1 ATPase component BioM of energizing module of biotin ECF transporter [Desulfosporosinus sp. I2]